MSRTKERNDMATTKPPTVEELAKRLDALEKENKLLKAKVEALENGGRGRGGGRSRYRALYSDDPNAPPEIQDDSITSDAVSDVLGGFIDTFNTKAERKEAPVGYMIGNMDIELKTQVIKDGNELILVAADPESAPEAISTVKMSVKAVPRANRFQQGEQRERKRRDE
jgi:hypothetical protein